MDLFSQMIIGWSVKSTLAKEIVLDTILIAEWRRQPKGEIHYSLGQEVTVQDR